MLSGGSSEEWGKIGHFYTLVVVTKMVAGETLQHLLGNLLEGGDGVGQFVKLVPQLYFHGYCHIIIMS